MNRRCNCICGDVSLVLIASLGLSLGFAGESFGQPCANDAGAGDTAEAEGCNLNGDDDTTNGGCNSSPPAFTDVDADGGLPRTYCSEAANYDNIQTCEDDDGCPDGDVCNVKAGLCEGPSQPSVNRRDTDWYLMSQAALTAADTDNNGVVRLLSAPTGEAGLDLVSFFITVDDLINCSASVVGQTGCWDSTGGEGQTVASIVVVISEHPSGVMAFVSPGLCTGAGVFNGFECSTGINDYTVTLSADPLFENGDFTACGDPADNPKLIDCNEANPGVGGCNDPACCKIVCGPGGFNILCCQDVPLGWIQQCADAAVDLGCAPEPGGPICMFTNGGDLTVDNALVVCSDPYGSWSADGFGGDGAGDLLWGDDYNPIGAEVNAEASFTNGFFFFDLENAQRELLSNIIDWQGAFDPDATLERTILGKGSVFFDTDADTFTDRLESSFIVTGAGTDVTFDLVQQISQVIPAGGTPVSVLTQTYTITNNSGAPKSFLLVRHLDLDLVWNGSTFSDDSVGTGTNDNPGLGTYAYQGEEGADPGTYITVAAETTGGQYYGSKSGIDPDGPGPGPTNGAGTDTQQWDAYGVPIGWENYIAGVGADIDGESGPGPIAIPPATGGPGADGSIGISIPVDLAGAGPASTMEVVVTTTYGANSPLGGGGEPCPWDCEVEMDGNVGINDFLLLLSQWTMVASCDFDGGGVGINDFLAILANWGPCP